MIESDEASRFGKEGTVAFVNKQSGERAAASFILRQLRKHLGDDNVFDLFPVVSPDVDGAKVFLERHMPSTVIVAGGDGTVSLTLDIMDELRGNGTLSPSTGHVAVLPMGTGNDLSRTLGFGGGYAKPMLNAEKKFEKVLQRIRDAEPAKIDRWRLVVSDVPNPAKASAVNGEAVSDIKNGKDFQQNMMNYFSIGFDAKVVTDFDQFRHDNPKACSKRSLNKLWYGYFGAQAMCTSSPLPRKKIKLIVDGESVSIPSDTKALLVTNVMTYAAGSVIWEDDKGRFAPPNISDRMLEVSVLNGVWHMMGVQSGVRKAKKVAQGSDVRIVAPTRYAIQYDGEAIRREGVKDGYFDVHLVHSVTTLVMMNRKHAVKLAKSSKKSRRDIGSSRGHELDSH